jgi:FkbM family methyltransferase
VRAPTDLVSRPSEVPTAVVIADTRESDSVHRIDGTLVRATIERHTVTFFVRNPNDEVQRHHYAGQFYEPEELQIIGRYFKPDGVFVDIGANVGNHTIYAAKLLLARRVIPFEVYPEAIEILRVNIALNECANVDTSYLGFAVAARDGSFTGRLIIQNNLGTYTLSPAAGSGPAHRSIRPDAVIAHTPVDFIKIDVEGMEMEALRGLEETVGRWRPAIFAEIQATEFAAFRAWTDQRQYGIAEKFGRYEDKTNYLIVPR